MNNIQNAISFIQNCEVQQPPQQKHKGLTKTKKTTIDEVLDETKNQSMVVGSSITSFATGLPVQLRSSITNCSLLAQLVADKKVKDENKIKEWYDVYFDSLKQLGWAEQARSFTEHRESGDDFEANEAIIKVATTIFGGAATALALITSTLDALKQMSNGPWLTLFKNRSQTAKAARFQITVAEPISDGAMVSLMSFTLHAKQKLTQVLFFRLQSSSVTLKHASGTVTLNTDLLAAINTKLKAKVEAHSTDWIESLGDI